jgi:hypothetical protein
MSRKKDVGLGREFHALMRLHDQIAKMSEFELKTIIDNDGDIETILIDDATLFGRLLKSITDYWVHMKFVSHQDRAHAESEAIKWMSFQTEDATACAVRSGMKYTIPVSETNNSWDRDAATIPTTPLRLPFPWITVSAHITSTIAKNTILMMFAEYRTVEEGYPELGVEPDEQFIAVNSYVFVSPNIYPIPVEIHFKVTDDIEPTYISAWLGKPLDEGGRLLNGLMIVFFTWWEMINNRTAKITTYRGLKPSYERKIKPLHGHKYPKFEHVVIERDLDPEPDPRGESTARAPGMVRKHFRAGHWRHFAKPLKSGPNKGKTRTWVQDCAPGNAEIGILKTDLVLTNGADT